MKTLTFKTRFWSPDYMDLDVWGSLTPPSKTPFFNARKLRATRSATVATVAEAKAVRS